MTIEDLKNKTVYLSGPMSGYPDHNFAAFAESRKALRDLGFRVVCPAEAGQVEGWEWEQYMRRDIIMMLLDCHGVITLPYWHGSRGARVEVELARCLKMPVYSLKSVMKVFEKSSSEG